MTKPKRSHMELLSASYLDLSNPDVADIHLDDIALALSQTCRWAGHCPVFFSVAEHACLVHDIIRHALGPFTWDAGLGASHAYLQRVALHHDDHEAYIGDLATPVKNVIGQAYYDIANDLDRVIAQRFDIRPHDFHNPAIKAADNLALFVEAERFKPSKGRHWYGRPEIVKLPKGVECAFGLSPVQAREQYLERAAL